MKITLKGHANIRHYFPGSNEMWQIETDAAETLGSIIERAGIPESEIMLLIRNEQVVTKTCIPAENDIIEIFPILAGG